jgi:3D (Asp-Asp-Asp) domain-containing protein
MMVLVLIGAAQVRGEDPAPLAGSEMVAAANSFESPISHVANEMISEDALVDSPQGEADTQSTRVLWMEVTAYCPCKKCCGPQAMGITASGKKVDYNDGGFVAADTSVLPFGTRLLVPGYHANRPIEVIDRGGAIKGHKLDVFYDTHEKAMEWGRKWVAVTVLE